MTNLIVHTIWIYIIYAMLGWCLEVGHFAVIRGQFINRGMLSGPYCPIYGFGMVLILNLLEPFKDNLFLLFISAILVTSLLEFLTGYVLEKIFHEKWWDYSESRYNLKGYICLENSIIWGFLCVFVVKLIHPMIEGVIRYLDGILGEVLLFIVMVLMLIDFILTITTLLKIKRHIRLFDTVALNLRKLSDQVGEEIFEGVQKASLVKQKTEEMLNEKALPQLKKGVVHRRLEKAYPNLKNLFNK